MPRISNFEILQKAAQPALIIRTITRVEDLPALIGASYGKMSSYLKEKGEFLAYVPYVAYYNMDMQQLDVEIGFPVAHALEGRGDIQAGSIPAGKYVFCMFRGPYNEVEPVYNEMAAWIKDQGYTPSGTAYEYYYNGPGFPESEMLTMIAMPLV
ncbi:MAG: GyrI-like domain-containing protein [Dethiobacteria bacterium]|jgi:effector-binding domain-containing protein